MNKTQYDVLFKDTQTCAQIYFDQRKSKTWLFNTLYALYQLEPQEATMTLIHRALKDQGAEELSNEWTRRMEILGMTKSLKEQFND